MPVVDHPVHPKTKRAADAKYGCHNRKPFAPGYMAPDRVYKEDGTFHTIQRRVFFTMSMLCKYDLWHSDPGCEGCKWMGGQVPSAKEIYKTAEECND